jgi:hypothetical protein
MWWNNHNKNLWSHEQHSGNSMPSSVLVIGYEVDKQANKKQLVIFVGLYKNENEERLHESSHFQY